MKKIGSHLVLPLFLFLFPGNASGQPQQQLTLEKIFRDHAFYPETIDNIRSTTDGEHYTILESDSRIVQYDYKTGKEKAVVFDVSEHRNNGPVSITDYVFSNDEKKILLTSQVSKIYRHSFEARYWIYDLVNKDIIPLEETGKQQLAAFSPDGLKVAFVKQNNLFYRNLIDGSTTQVTSDGETNRVINGAPDWVYEEEFGFSQAYCWSPDSRWIAFYRFDESSVKEFEMNVFNGLYPAVNRFKYPKAGEDNSLVTIHVYDLESRKIRLMDTGKETDQYIPRIKWTTSPDHLCIIRLNRLQNKVEVLLASPYTGNSSVVYTEENEKFISDIDDNFIHFTGDGKFFILHSERSGNFHFYLHRLDGSLVSSITSGHWDARKLLGYDERKSIIYFTANQESEIQQHVYSVKLNGKNMQLISGKAGTHDAEFSSNFRYFIDIWSDANNPFVYNLCRNDGTVLRTLEENNRLKKTMQQYGFNRKKFIRIPVSDSLELNAYLIKPADFDSTKKYPLFMSVYGGPGAQDVTDSWDNELAWQQLLAQHGIVVACIDNRGTDGRGEAFRKSTYLELGKLETEDHMNAARYLGNIRWIDRNRIGIWGWSYGGYMTLLCLTRGADVFSMGIAVAPVTNWRFYDNIYTERYMRKPQDNSKGYDDHSPINHAGLLKGKLLLVHGTADDNVHLQNSIEMSERLISENKQFQQFFYPNKNHSLYGGNTRLHLYTMMTDFILKEL